MNLDQAAADPVSQRRARRPVLAGLAAVLLSAALPGAAFAASADEIVKRGVINVATEDDFRPFEFVDNGKPTGFDNELLEAVKKKLKVQVKQNIMPWPGILPGVTTGKYDMAVTAVLVTEERKKIFDFTSPVAESTTFYATKKGSPIATAEGLRGKTIAAQTGSAMLADLKAFDEKLKAAGGGVGKIVEYASYPEAYQDLALGRVDAVVNTQINLNSLIATRADTFVLGQKVGNPVFIAWAVKKGEAGALGMVDKALLELRGSGEMYALQKKWFGTSFESMPKSVAP